MANVLLERYQNGEQREVWRDLVVLGERVRDAEYFDDAQAIAAETMRRARQNVESIITKLEKLGYEFTTAPPTQPVNAMFGGQTVGMDALLQMALQKTQSYQQPGFQPRNTQEQAMSNLVQSLGSLMTDRKQAPAPVPPASSGPPLSNTNVFAPPTSKIGAALKRGEKELGGPLPLSLHEWYRQVGAVNLMGRHEKLNPIEAAESPDPLVIDPLEETIESAYSEDESQPREMALAPDDLHKAHTSGGDPYSMVVPNAAADGLFLYERHHAMFTDYLRLVFAWGGFPGWEGSPHAPEKEIAYLNEGLLAI